MAPKLDAVRCAVLRCPIDLAIRFSEDHLGGRGLWALVGDEMVKFHEELRSQPLPAYINELVATITPPEGVKYVQRRMLFNRMFHGMRDLSASMGMKSLRMTMMRGGGEEATLSENISRIGISCVVAHAFHAWVLVSPSVTPRSLIRNPVANMRCACKASQNPPRSLISYRFCILDTRVRTYPEKFGAEAPEQPQNTARVRNGGFFASALAVAAGAKQAGGNRTAAEHLINRTVSTQLLRHC